jgi:hypothetical protein
LRDQRLRVSDASFCAKGKYRIACYHRRPSDDPVRLRQPSPSRPALYSVASAGFL